MPERGSAPYASRLLRGSGLDTSNGPEFIQQRLALLARMIALITVAFLVVGMALTAVVGAESGPHPILTATIAHVSGLAILTAIWLVTRRGRLSLRTLEILDGAAIVGPCAAWAFFVTPDFLPSIFGAVVSVSLTVLARAIVVPSSAARTLRLSLLAVVPLLGTMAWWMRTVASVDGQPPVVTAVFQTFLLGVVIVMATVASRIIYDLRKSVREANELGSYTLEEKLGAGGMGEVWRARHRFLVRTAAVKLIRPELLSSNRADPRLLLRRFEREARATAALRSPHTVQLYDFGQADDGALFYVMELLSGIDLENLVRRFGPVPAERAIHILRQVCHSLAEAHENGLTHRDIKPANIFVSCIGIDTDFVKVLDFGLVRLHQDRPAADQVKLTADGTVGGTPAYAAPEIVLGNERYDHRVDIYSLGCVGYWLLTGQLVFEGDTPLRMMLSHAHTPPVRPHTRTELPIAADVEDIIMDCLEKDPARRPPSAAALAARLAACTLASAWTPERAERWWRAHMPEQVGDRPVAEMLLSEEDAPSGMRLVPRRAPHGDG
jgi:serine/threonine-protein kinase